MDRDRLGYSGTQEPGTITEMVHEKLQPMRLLDVFFLGPLMIWFALRHVDPIDPLPAYTLAFFGVTTILYNGYNWMGNVVRWLPPLPF